MKMILPIRTDYLKIYKSLNLKETYILGSYKGIGYLQINEILYDNIKFIFILKYYILLYILCLKFMSNQDAHIVHTQYIQ